jgi:hypothetical protein
VFADPNLHVHCVVLNLATRQSDRTIGGLHSKIIRDWKMAAGATYHAALAHELEQIGFAIDRVGKNGVFEIAGVDGATIRYFSARRQQIEDELAEHGVTSSQAVALASAIAKATRSSKRESESREDVWHEAARSLGLDVETFTESLRDPSREHDRELGERLLADRLAALPAGLTEHESVVERRELLRSVAAAFVGTGLSVERVDAEVSRLLSQGAVVEIGCDALGLPCYSTPEILAIERNVVAQAQRLAHQSWFTIDQDSLRARCKIGGLTAEQADAALAATTTSAVAIIEGAPGVGKSTLLAPIVEEYVKAGCRVIATASAWRIANMLRDDLGVEARATASWIARLSVGEKVLDNRTVLIADEAGLLSSREMHALLGAVSTAGAKIILVGDRQQFRRSAQVLASTWWRVPSRQLGSITSFASVSRGCARPSPSSDRAAPPRLSSASPNGTCWSKQMALKPRLTPLSILRSAIRRNIQPATLWFSRSPMRPWQQSRARFGSVERPPDC